MKKLLFLILVSALMPACFGQLGLLSKKLPEKGKSEKIIFTNKEYANYDAAKENAVNEIKDGDELWMYVKMPKPLKEYAYIDKFADKDGNMVENASLGLEIAKRGSDYGNFAVQTIFLKGGEVARFDKVFAKGQNTYLDLDYNTATEFKLVLSKYIRRRSSFVMLKAVGGGNIGKWDNEIRLTGGSNKDKVLAKGELMCNVENGIAAYRKAWNAYKEILDKGDIADNKLPPTGKFNDQAVRNAVMKHAKAEEMNAEKVVFTTDSWIITTDDYDRKIRQVYAYITYKKDGKCMYAMAEVTQSFVLGDWAAVQAGFYKKDTPYQCGK